MLVRYLSRRSVFFGALATAGCGIRLASIKGETSAFDGQYVFDVSRVVLDSKSTRQDPRKIVGSSSHIARITTVCEGGTFRVVKLEDKFEKSGPNYTDFRAAFTAAGVLRFSASTSYLSSKREVETISFSEKIGPLVFGGSTYVVSKRLTEDWAANVQIKRIAIPRKSRAGRRPTA